MIKRTLLSIGLVFFAAFVHAQEKMIVKDMKISRTTKIKKGNYFMQGNPGPIVLIEGDNITIDFNNSILNGANPASRKPNEYTGICVLIRNSKNVIIRNLKASGYKIALRAENSDNLILDNCDFSYNYRQQLNSTQEKEDISDWMSYHQNEKDEWLRYGAAMYLRNCDSITVRNCKVTGGQNALMLTQCNDGMIYNNDFSFNSGIGIGMYRSSRNKLMYNRVIFNVRGYSHGVYNRGQDSAGILVYEQSNSNLFYKNAATHSGDGFFLWAGQSTMDSGQGGCNDNQLLNNDFSYAPANGIEVTFSRNTIVNNRLFECDYGIWGGYSYESNISNNKFRDNRIDIAIEHGQDNKITYNVFYDGKEAIRLWARKEQPADWGYAKYRDTRSRDYVIALNNFSRCKTAMNISRTDKINVFANIYGNVETVIKADSTVTGLDTTFKEQLFVELSTDTAIASLPEVTLPSDPFRGAGKLAGRKNIMVTQWGPYDFRSPVIWNTNPTDSGNIMKFDLLGPAGKWTIKQIKGVKNVSFMKGGFPTKITAEKITGPGTDILIELEYVGSAITTPMGVNLNAGHSYKFSFRKFFLPIDWEVAWYAIDTAVHNPLRTGMLFSPLEKKAPVKTEKVNKLDYAWWGGISADKQYTQFLTIATATAEIPKGIYEIGLTWDDAVRLYIDNKLVLDEWNPALYKFDESPHRKIRVPLGGKHQFRVEHVELGGFATLSLKLTRV
jgi:parallel beta-helix repeat protein